MISKLYRITAPHFVAGITVQGYDVDAAAPILAYMKGWPLQRVQWYCKRKGWTVEQITPQRAAEELGIG